MILKSYVVPTPGEKQYSIPCKSSGIRYPPSPGPPIRINSFPQCIGRSLLMRPRTLAGLACLVMFRPATESPDPNRLNISDLILLIILEPACLGIHEFSPQQAREAVGALQSPTRLDGCPPTLGDSRTRVYASYRRSLTFTRPSHCDVQCLLMLARVPKVKTEILMPLEASKGETLKPLTRNS